MKNETEKEKVCVLDACGIYRDGFLLANKIPNKMGLLEVLDTSNNSIVCVHPKRIGNINGSIATSSGENLIAACPTCGLSCRIDNAVGICGTHGKFSIAGKTPDKEIKQEQESKIDSTVNLKELSSKGEIWVKDNIKFDHEQVQVMAVNFRYNNRYVVFNLYNNSFGRRGNIPPIEELISGKEVGYKITDREKWQKKLIQNGYKILEESK